MHLPSTFHHKSWSIRYALLNPTRSSQTTKSLVFIHGTPWSSAVYEPLIQSLLAGSSATYRILVYDLPGYGQSQLYSPSPSTTIPDTNPSTDAKPSFEGDTSVAFQASALTALLSHTGLSSPSSSSSPPAVIAHDIAGAIALRTHLLHGVDFASMLLCDTNAVLPWGDGFYNLVRESPKVFLDLPGHVYEAMVRAVVRSALHRPEAREEWVESLASPWIGGAEKQSNFVRQIAQADDGDVREMLEGDVYQDVRGDVKILWGAEDDWIPRGKMEELRRRIGGRVKEFVVLEGAGHLVMLDRVGEFEREVRGWLERGE